MVMVVAVRSKGTRVSNVATKGIAVAQMRLQAADTQRRTSHGSVTRGISRLRSGKTAGAVARYRF
jgi:hypothetical protein